MSVSTIPANITAMLNKAYNTDTGTVTASNHIAQQPAPVSAGNQPPASASTTVSLGQNGNTIEIYTMQGLLQHMRQIQPGNTRQLSGDSAYHIDDGSSRSDLPGNTDHPELEGMRQD